MKIYLLIINKAMKTNDKTYGPNTNNQDIEL